MPKPTIWEACRQLAEELNREWRVMVKKHGVANKNFYLKVVRDYPERIELRCLTAAACGWGRERRNRRDKRPTAFGYPIEVVPPPEHEV